MALQDDALTGPVTFTAQVRDEEGVTFVCLQGEVDLSNADRAARASGGSRNAHCSRRCESISLG